MLQVTESTLAVLDHHEAPDPAVGPGRITYRESIEIERCVVTAQFECLMAEMPNADLVLS